MSRDFGPVGRYVYSDIGQFLAALIKLDWVVSL